MTPALLAGLTGVIQGARHALEPDHVTAVATVMVEAPSSRRGMFYAACWGSGHAAMLLLVAGPLVLLRVELPGLLTTVLELAVGAMLIYLGIHTLRSTRGPRPRIDQAAPALVRGRRPFAIGVLHGLAGSGALAALIALGSPTASAGLACLAFYALGTIAGMVALAAVAGSMLARAGRLPRLAPAIAQIAGIASIAVGLAWTVRTLAG
jgi:high-affinity nickel-transport protein